LIAGGACALPPDLRRAYRNEIEPRQRQRQRQRMHKHVAGVPPLLPADWTGRPTAAREQEQRGGRLLARAAGVAQHGGRHGVDLAGCGFCIYFL